MPLSSSLSGTYHLFSFFATHTATLRLLPPWLRNPDILDRQMVTASCRMSVNSDEPTPIVLTAPNLPKGLYETDLEKLKAKIRKLHAGEKAWDYKSTLAALFGVRFLVCAIAMYTGSTSLAFGASLLQFAVAPYSLFVSYCLAFVMGPPQFVAAYGVNVLLNRLVTATYTYLLLPHLSTAHLDLLNLAGSHLTLTFSLSFIAFFFAVDQLLCCYCLFFTDSIKYSPTKIATHVTWGFINCKTYFVVLLALLYHGGKTYSLIPWILDYLFDITPKVTAIFTTVGMNWGELFYHQHRMGHLPRVYDQAHKLHHYLHGATAFDAHIYGSGMPEEWFLLAIDVVASVHFGLMPSSLNHMILYHSWTNKVGHTEQEEDHDGNNFHSDHHIHHRLNFGIYNCLLDVYFDTAVKKEDYNFRVGLYSGNTAKEAQKGGAEDQFKIKVERDEKETRFIFTPAGGSWKKARAESVGEKIKAE